MKDKIIRYYLIINILCAYLIFCQKQQACNESDGQTCEGTQEHHKYTKTDFENDTFDDLINSEFFLKQPIITKENINNSIYNTTKYFDFSLNKKILSFIRFNEAVPYPNKRFKDKQQGNFLHFMHLAYEKNLPVYFSLDQMIYPYIEITKQLNYDIVEFAFFPIYKTFLNNLINFGMKHNYDNEIILYFIIGSKFLYENKEIEKNVEINQQNFEIVKNNFKYCNAFLDKLLLKEENDTNYSIELELLGKKRIFNKFNFLKINKKFKEGNIISQKITNSLRYFQELVFDASTELYTIYSIGKLIEESGQNKIYFAIKKFIKYLFNEDEDNMNPVEIYKFINENFTSLNKDDKEINSLYDKIKEKIIKPKFLNFLNYTYFVDEKQEKEYLEEKNKQINLFSYSTSIEDWVNNKMINFKKGRIFPSILEFLEIVFDAKMGRRLLFKRFDKKEIKDKMFSFRDGIDMRQELVNAKNLIEKSYKEERDKWLNSYDYSFYYLLYIVGNSVKGHEREKLIKSFNTIIGSYVHFKKDILIIKQYSNITYCEDGNIPDIYFENNTKFYNELKEITKIYKEHLVNLTEYLDRQELKERVIQVINLKLNYLFNAYDNIIKILTSNSTDEINTIKNKMLYYNRKMQMYSGWYVDLYKNNRLEIEFNLDIYVYNYFIANPISQIDFDGAIIYEAMHYPEIGLLTVKDTGKNLKKRLYLFSSYTGMEYPHRYEKKIDFKGLQKSILARQY